MACRALILVSFCTCVVFCTAIPTRRQFVSLTETTSSEPSAVVTNEGAVWDENDDFDLDGDDEWLGGAPASPSSLPQRAEYEEEEYVDDGEDDDRQTSKSDAEEEEDDIDHQDAEEDEDSEFLFMPSRETRLVLQDDDDQSGPIKVRHTGKNSYPDVTDSDNSMEDSFKEDKNEDSQHFEFTIDNNEEDDDDSENEVEDKDDFVLEDTLPKRREVDEEEDDTDSFVDGEDEDDPVFENPEEDSQVIYGDHLFLY